MCTHLKGVKGWRWVGYNNPWLFSEAENNKKKKVLHGSGLVWTVEKRVALSCASLCCISAAIVVVLCVVRAGFLLLSQTEYDFIGLITHWIPMALDCFLNVSLDESY